jgi:hypothetical protein
MVDSYNDAPLDSFMDLITSPKVKIMKEKGVGARSLARNTVGVKGCAKD